MSLIVEAREPGGTWKQVSGPFDTQDGAQDYAELFRRHRPQLEVHVTTAPPKPERRGPPTRPFAF